MLIRSPSSISGSENLSMPSSPGWSSRPEICLLLIAFTATSILFMQSFGSINSDVSFLTWTARQVMGAPVFGVDIYEVNPPLAFLIYAPAAFLGPLVEYDLAIKLWITSLACLSVAMFWNSCDVQMRLPLTVALALITAFLLPSGFGQREQIAFLLTAPYAAGSSRNRGGAVISGVMAAIGFCIKPYFLIPLALIFITRRRIGMEERAIIVTGCAYAISLLLFFRPYLFEFLPLARATYSAYRMEDSATATWQVTGFILLSAVPFSLAGSPQPGARGFIAASFGFTAAAFIQYKGLGYHFIAAWGFLNLFLVARVFNKRPIIAVCAAIDLLALAFMMRQATIDFMTPSQNQKLMAQLLPEIDRAPSYLSFAYGPFPAFPTALYTESEYKGMAIWPIFISAAREPLGGRQLQDRARQLTIDQAVRELQRKPALVIVEQQDSASGWARSRFDLISFLQTDTQFRQLWDRYTYEKTIGDYRLYRLQ